LALAQIERYQNIFDMLIFIESNLTNLTSIFVTAE